MIGRLFFCIEGPRLERRFGSYARAVCSSGLSHGRRRRTRTSFRVCHSGIEVRQRRRARCLCVPDRARQCAPAAQPKCDASRHSPVTPLGGMRHGNAMFPKGGGFRPSAFFDVRAALLTIPCLVSALCRQVSAMSTLDFSKQPLVSAGADITPT